MRVCDRHHAARRVPARVGGTLEELEEPYELKVITHEWGRCEEHRTRHPRSRARRTPD